MKAALSEIKKTPQGTNSAGDEAKIQINNLERKDEIRTQPKQQKEKRILKKRGYYKEALGHLEMYQHPNHRDARRRRGRARS